MPYEYTLPEGYAEEEITRTLSTSSGVSHAPICHRASLPRLDSAAISGALRSPRPALWGTSPSGTGMRQRKETDLESETRHPGTPHMTAREYYGSVPPRFVQTPHNQQTGSLCQNEPHA